LLHFVSRFKEINQGSPTDTLPGLEGAIQLVRNNFSSSKVANSLSIKRRGSFSVEDVIEVTCWDKDQLTSADILGFFVIKLGDFMKPGEHTKV